MGTKLPAPDEELYRAVDEVLHYIWDPIGVAGVPQARDEYYSYLPQVFRRIKEGAAAIEIADYLSRIATEHMGLSENRAHDLEVVEILLEWKAAIDEKHS
jgi:hypothetical protein